MVFVSDPRQVGKTTVCEGFQSHYLNWDKRSDRDLLLKGEDAVAEAVDVNLANDVRERGLLPIYMQTAAEAGVPDVAEQSRPLDFCYRVQWLCWKFLPRPLFLLACRAMYAYFFRRAYGVQFRPECER